MLSAWWRRWQPYILLTLLALPALWPLAGAGLARTNDSLPHLYRVVALEALLRAGVLLPRWAPDLVHGYGYPVFNYFPYLAHYLVAALHGLGLGFLTAYNAACGLVLLASGWLAYRLGREHFGTTAGLVAGAAYLYSPYLLYDTYIRGSLPENLALALLPLILLQLRRAGQGQRRARAYAALALAAALLAHQGVMLQAMPFLAAYALWPWEDSRKTKDERRNTTDDRLLEPADVERIDERLPRVVTDEGALRETGQAGAVAATVEPSPGGIRERLTWPLGTEVNSRNTHHASRLAARRSVGSPVPAHRLTAIPPSLHSFALALLLSAFFWLPALAEAGYAQIARGTGNGGMSYTDNFLSLRELLAWPRLPVDPGLLNPPVVRSLPLAALLLAALTGLRWRFQRLAPRAGGGYAGYSRAQSRALAFLALAALAGTLLIHPVARPLWDTLPLLKLTLFPWRLLGPVSLFVALVAGAVFAEGKEGSTHTGAVRPWPLVATFILQPAAISLLILAGLPFATPPREFPPPAPTLADLARFEVPPDFIGTTTVGEYLPVWVRSLPDTAPNRDQLLAGQPVQRHEAPGAAVQVVASRPAGDTYRVEAPAPLTFLYRAFYFPGWRATLDGQPARIAITYPEGLMTVAVPAGTHTLSLHFGTTPARVVGGVLSLLGLLGTSAVLLPAGAKRRTSRPATDGRHPSPSSVALSGHPAPVVLFALAATLALGRPLLYDAGRTPLLQRGPRPAVALNLDYATELTLVGLDSAATALAADDELRVDLYWLANHPLGIPYGFDVRLVDAAGHTWSEPPERPRDWRFTPGTDFWPTDQYVLDPYRLRPIPGTPPGVYSLRVNVFAVPTVQSVGTYDVLEVTVTAPSRAHGCPAEGDTEGAWDGVRLAGVRLSTASAAPGDEVVVSPCWQVVGNSAEAAPHAGLDAELRLLDDAGQVAARQPFTPGSPYPAERWQPGDTLRDQVEVRLPANLATGDYTWAVAVNGSPAQRLGTLTVTAPERAFTPPAVDSVLDADLGPLALYGVSVPRAGLVRGGDLPLTLVWQANRLLPESYHVFVHLFAPDGSLAAQSDGVPAAWTRRTTGWLPGEYVMDARTLFIRTDLPAGTYTLWAGIYLPATGERLVTEEFGDGRVGLGTVVVE